MSLGNIQDGRNGTRKNIGLIWKAMGRSFWLHLLRDHDHGVHELKVAKLIFSNYSWLIVDSQETYLNKWTFISRSS